MGKVLDGIMGLVVGDALGVPVEFTSRGSLYLNPVKGMTGFGTYDQPVGTWSDDSSVTFALMNSLLRGYNINHICCNYLSWYRDSRWTPHNEVFDISITMRESLHRFEDGVTPTECGSVDIFDNGNATLMRLLPLAYYLKNIEGIDKRYSIIKEFVAFTNKTDIFYIASCFFIDFTIHLIKGRNKDDAFEFAVNNIQLYFRDESYKRYIKYVERIVDKSILIQNSIGIRRSGFIVDSLECTLWCLFSTDSYEACLLKAVNLCADTDTIGGITGALAGLVYGFDNIPSEWVDKIVMKDEIMDMIDTFAQLYD